MNFDGANPGFSETRPETFSSINFLDYPTFEVLTQNEPSSSTSHQSLSDSFQDQSERLLLLKMARELIPVRMLHLVYLTSPPLNRVPSNRLLSSVFLSSSKEKRIAHGQIHIARESSFVKEGLKLNVSNYNPVT